MSKTEEFRRIYIRHADKEYANGDADMFKHDPGITENGVEKSKMVARHLVDQWGKPNRIIVSPYRRTRETAAQMNSILEKPVPIHVDISLSEYLGNHRTVPIDVTERTKVHEPPHPESFSDMKRRVRRHNQKISAYGKTTGNGIVWIVTHGLIIKQVADLMGVKMAKEFPTLTCLSIVEGEKIIRSEVIIFNETNPDNTRDDLNNRDNTDRDNRDSMENMENVENDSDELDQEDKIALPIY